MHSLESLRSLPSGRAPGERKRGEEKRSSWEVVFIYSVAQAGRRRAVQKHCGRVEEDGRKTRLCRGKGKKELARLETSEFLPTGGENMLDVCVTNQLDAERNMFYSN